METELYSMDDYAIKQLVRLIGYEIVKVLQSPDKETGEIYLGLLLKKGKDEKTLWFLKDEEDNGAGFFQID